MKVIQAWVRTLKALGLIAAAALAAGLWVLPPLAFPSPGANDAMVLAGAALDTVVKSDPTAVRALNEGSFPIYGAIGLIISALMLASAGYAILGTGVLPRWTGWFACAAALLNLAAAPSILGGTDITGFYTASGYAPFVGQAAMLIWFFVASVSMIAKREERAAPPVPSVTSAS